MNLPFRRPEKWWINGAKEAINQKRMKSSWFFLIGAVDSCDDLEVVDREKLPRSQHAQRRIHGFEFGKTSGERKARVGWLAYRVRLANLHAWWKIGHLSNNIDECSKRKYWRRKTSPSKNTLWLAYRENHCWLACRLSTGGFACSSRKDIYLHYWRR